MIWPERRNKPRRIPGQRANQQLTLSERKSPDSHWSGLFYHPENYSAGATDQAKYREANGTVVGCQSLEARISSPVLPMSHSEFADFELPDKKSLIGPSILAIGLIVLGLAFWSDYDGDPAPSPVLASHNL